MRHSVLLISLSLTACTATLPPFEETPDMSEEQDSDAPAAQHSARFVGLWAVEQPYHAAYEVTRYDFQATGALVVLDSWPDGCSGHLSEHCVTGSVSDCVAEPDNVWCEAERTCVFGDRWHSEDDQTLVIEGQCTDGISRDIVLHFGNDPSQNAESGADVTLLTVDGQTGWSHNGWEWAFRKCQDDGSECGWMP